MMHQSIIQEILAKLIVKPSILNDINKLDFYIKNYENLDQDNKEIISNFFIEHGDRFRASAKLLNKKRYDAVEESLQILRRYSNKIKLYQYWMQYLTLSENHDTSATNPIYESVRFCKFMKTMKVFQYDILNELLDYEVARNEVIIAYSENNIGIEFSAGVGSLIIHPSVRIIENQYSLSEVIKNQNLEFDCLCKYEKCEKLEKLVIFKNFKRGGVSCLKINPFYEFIINFLIGTYNIDLLYREAKLINVTQEKIDNIVKILENYGLIACV